MTFVRPQSVPHNLPLILVTHARRFKSPMNGQSSCGTLQSQTIVVRVVTVLSTKLTLSWTLSTWRMNVKQQTPQSAEFSQVKKSKSKKYISNYYFEKDLDKAVVKKE
mgnify:CR=1 FL=1